MKKQKMEHASFQPCGSKRTAPLNALILQSFFKQAPQNRVSLLGKPLTTWEVLAIDLLSCDKLGSVSTIVTSPQFVPESLTESAPIPISATPRRRMYAYSEYLQNTFAGKTYKIVVASGLTCPTRDGSLAKGGCAFCDVRGSSSFFGKQGRGKAIEDQIRAKLPEVQSRFGATRFLAYFQSYTNTYGDVDYLRQIFEAALAVPAISGLCIGTRPDCLSDEVLALLEEMAQKTYVSLELGVQSFENPTLEWLARGHSAECSIEALEKLRSRAPHVHVCVHLMFGSPTDSETAAKDAALILNQTGVRGAKLHQLMILENTELARRMQETPFEVLSLESYISKLVEFVRHLSPEIYLERLYATATHSKECLAPAWSTQRWTPHNRIRDAFEQLDCIQGDLLAKPASQS